MTNRRERLSAAQARRVALAAQGFADRRPTGRIDRRHVRKVLDRVGVVQIDSVNIVARNHELPLYARLGHHPRNALIDASHRQEVFEYWGHEASFIPVAKQPLLRHKMAAAAEGATWTGLSKLAVSQPRLIEDIYAAVAERGPLSARELPASVQERAGGRKGPWWGWNNAKVALEYLFWCGRIGARRRPSFEREYGLPHHFVPAEVLAQPTLPEATQRRLLLADAARSLGVATAKDLADYYRLNAKRAAPLLDELVEDGVLIAAEVEGWGQPAWLWPGARTPRRVEAATLLSPFDSLVWERARTERIFGFRYRLEFYTPAPKRIYGYYVMPFLLGEQLVARVDLKLDRPGDRLLVLGSFAEQQRDAPGDEKKLAGELAAELHHFATFLGVGDVIVESRGDLAASLAPEVRSGHPA